MALDAGQIQYGNAISSPVALDATGDKFTFSILEPCEVYEVGVLVTTGSAANAFTGKFDRRPTAGSDSSRGDGDVGTLTSPATIAAGKLLRKFVSARLNKGDQVVFEVTEAGATAAGGVPYMKAYPSGQAQAESDDVDSTV